MTAARCDRSDLCAELAGSSGTEFEAVYGMPATSRQLKSAMSAVAIADLSPLTVGHTIVLPRPHLLNIGQALATDDGDAFADFTGAFLADWEHSFGSYALLEHGSSSDMRGAACISHAHLHVVAANAEQVAAQMASDGLKLTSVAGGWLGLRGLARLDEPYFFVGDKTFGLVAVNPPKMSSQYLRIAVGATLGYEAGECDWAAVIRRDLLDATLKAWAKTTDSHAVD